MTEEEVLARHVFREAVGGYIECSCGWPNKKQWSDGEYEVMHVIDDLIANGHLAKPEILPGWEERMIARGAVASTLEEGS